MGLVRPDTSRTQAALRAACLIVHEIRGCFWRSGLKRPNRSNIHQIKGNFMKNPKNNVNTIESTLGFRNLGISEGDSIFFPKVFQSFQVISPKLSDEILCNFVGGLMIDLGYPRWNLGRIQDFSGIWQLFSYFFRDFSVILLLFLSKTIGRSLWISTKLRLIMDDIFYKARWNFGAVSISDFWLGNIFPIFIIPSFSHELLYLKTISSKVMIVCLWNLADV